MNENVSKYTKFIQLSSLSRIERDGDFGRKTHRIPLNHVRLHLENVLSFSLQPQ